MEQLPMAVEVAALEDCLLHMRTLLLELLTL
jgi:hypothetical protein